MNISISNNKLTAIINSSGAELISLRKEAKECIWEGNPEFWGKHSPILFPIVGTLKNNAYRYNNKEYKLSRHGFAREHDFQVLETSKDKVVFSLSSSDETLKAYPFEFELRISYMIENNSLAIKYEVINKGMQRMPFSIGGHPAFALPDNFEAYSLKFENDESITSYSLKDDLLSNDTKTFRLEDKQLQLTYSLFENDALIFKKLNSDTVQILESEKPYLEVSFRDFPNLGIWTKNKAPFLCIEPWFGYSDTLENSGDLFGKEGINILESNETFTASFEIKIN